MNFAAQLPVISPNITSYNGERPLYASVNLAAGPTGAAGTTGAAGPTGPNGIAGESAPSPTALITSNKLVSPIGLPGGPSSFPLDIAFPTVSGAEYDIQIRGVMSYVSGTTTVTDTIFFTLSVGGATGTWIYGAQPYGLGGTGNFQIRDRLICASPLANITLTAYNTQISPSTARYQVSLQQIDINRVK